jgi:hypothetical protein
LVAIRACPHGDETRMAWHDAHDHERQDLSGVAGIGYWAEQGRAGRHHINLVTGVGCPRCGGQRHWLAIDDSEGDR